MEEMVLICINEEKEETVVPINAC